MRILTILVFLALAVFIIWELGRVWLLLQKSKELIKNSGSFQRINPEAKIKILILGDSTAAGTGSADAKLSVAGRFGRDFPDVHIINLGKNGNHVKNLAEEFELEAYKDFNLVIIQAGGNDILRFTPLRQLEKDLDTLLKKAKQASIQVIVLHSGNIGLAPFFPRPFGWIWSYRTRQVRELYMRLAKEHGAVYVDLFTDRKSDPFLKDVSKFYAPDLLHASGDGYGIWYQKIRETMESAGIEL